MKRKRVALITGANKGIGFEIARQLAEKGYRVFLTARDATAGQVAAKKIGATFLQLDVSNEKSIVAAAREFGQHSDRLDVLFNNAGIIVDGDEEILKATGAQWTETIRTNALGPLFVTQAFVPSLKKSDRPRVVNVSSSGGQLQGGADGWAPVYCISKTTLNSVTLQLAASLRGFAVNCVCPGWVRTDMGGPNASEDAGEAAADLVWLADEAPQNLTGKFLRHRHEIPW